MCVRVHRDIHKPRVLLCAYNAPSHPGRWADEHDISINLIPCLLLAVCASISTREVYIIIIIIIIYKCTTYAASNAHSRQTICTATPVLLSVEPSRGRDNLRGQRGCTQQCFFYPRFCFSETPLGCMPHLQLSYSIYHTYTYGA